MSNTNFQNDTNAVCMAISGLAMILISIRYQYLNYLKSNNHNHKCILIPIQYQKSNPSPNVTKYSII